MRFTKFSRRWHPLYNALHTDRLLGREIPASFGKTNRLKQARFFDSRRRSSAASRIKSLRQSHQLPSGNDSKCEIVAVASRVAGLQVVTIHRHDRTIRQVAEGAADGISARVTDQSQS